MNWNWIIKFRIRRLAFLLPDPSTQNKAWWGIGWGYHTTLCDIEKKTGDDYYYWTCVWSWEKA